MCARIGEEVCIARQDHVLDIAGSGSVKEGDLSIVRDFAATISSKYQAGSSGHEGTRIAIVSFGNGKLNT